MGEPPRPVRIEWRPGITLTEYAAKWVDMAPHIDALREYASKARTIVEFGVRGGVSTWAMLGGLSAKGVIHAVDNDPDVMEMTPPWVLEDPRLKLVIGDDLKVDLPDKADLVMIDSGHEYQQTLDELAIANDLEPSLILLHDYLYTETPGVRQAVDWWTSEAGGWRLATVHPSQWGLAVLSPL
jgi:hypothetical protein